MRIKNIKIKGFKRFTDLTIKDIPENGRLVILVGPNGSGKTSLLDALMHWYRYRGFGTFGKQDYYEKNPSSTSKGLWYQNLVNIDFHDITKPNRDEIQGKFYFRSAYRNEPDFVIKGFHKLEDPSVAIKLESFIHNDVTVSDNYQRLISQTISGLFDLENEEKYVKSLRDEIIGKIQLSLNNIFPELRLNSIGDPLTSGGFYFEKGTSKNFHYKNLSSGEKAVFDLILDMIIKSSYYQESIYCIDEPEAHMHTNLQSKVLKELYFLTPPHSQLWISTHSIGMLKQATELEKLIPGSVVFLDFNNRDFDQQELLLPSIIDKTIWNRFFDLTFGEFSELIAPRQIVFCEGSSNGNKFHNFDATIYSLIFGKKYHDTVFISLGSSNEIENIDNKPMAVVTNLLNSSTIIKFVDRDDKSIPEIKELLNRNIKTSKRRHIESYLFDDEIIRKLCQVEVREDLIDVCLEAKFQALNKSIARGNPVDDLKSASGTIYVELKRILSLTGCGNNAAAFMRDTLAPLITEDTKVYQELESEIFF